MKSIPGPLLAHLKGQKTTLALCWRIIKRDAALLPAPMLITNVTYSNPPFGRGPALYSFWGSGGFSAGEQVTVSGVVYTGPTNPNGTWTVASSNAFGFTVVVPNGSYIVYISGGLATAAYAGSTEIFGTDHDQDIVISSGGFAGTYRAASNITPSNFQSNADLSTDNVEVTGALSDGTLRLDISSADLESGNLDFAAFVCFFCNWANPNSGQVMMRSGFFGQLSYDSTYGYKVELRGLSQLLQQNFMQTYTDRCNVVHFGDARCKINVPALTVSVTVTAVANNRSFTVSVLGGTFSANAQWFNGFLSGLSGGNTGFLREVQSISGFSSSGTSVVLRKQMPVDVHVGDTFSMAPGCDRLLATCATPYNNVVNFRGYGIFIPGLDALISGPAGMVGQSPVGGTGGLAGPGGGGGGPHP